MRGEVIPAAALRILHLRGGKGLPRAGFLDLKLRGRRRSPARISGAPGLPLAAPGGGTRAMVVKCPSLDGRS